MKPLMRKAAAHACAVLALMAAPTAMANNIQISNVSLANGGGGNATIQFDLSWENSWKGGGVSNHDAAWVFVKYQTPAGIWSHAYLSPTGNAGGPGCEIINGKVTDYLAHDPITNPVVGVFMERTADGYGTFNVPGNQIVWNYAVLGLAFNDISRIQVFAIEMVFVPGGMFQAGGFTSIGPPPFNGFEPTSISNSVANEPSGYPTGSTPPANVNYPNGTRAFYCMKYELSQQAYVDFLNTLSNSTQATRTNSATNASVGTGALNATNSNRNGIDVQQPAPSPFLPAVYACNLNANAAMGETDDGQDIACNWLSAASLSAYLDWSGLRPMSELEFEKACRGPLTLPGSGDRAWGTEIDQPGWTVTLDDQGTSNERISNDIGMPALNANTSEISANVAGPIRVGAFASNASSRTSAGSTYYGVMNMGDNLFEQVVKMEGSNYDGSHGNGVLNPSDGSADVGNWPFSLMKRGGSWSWLSYYGSVGMRYFAIPPHFPNNAPANDVGGRGVRSAP